MSGAVNGAIAPHGAARSVGTEREVRVCIVGPSLDILGGQSVQLARLLERLQGLPGLHVDFLPVNPRLSGLFGQMQRIKYLRTVVTSAAYVSTLLSRLGHYDVVHAFSASYWSYVLAPLPAMLVGRLYHRGVLLNYHSGEAEDHLRRWRRTAVPSMRLANRIIVPSEYLCDVFSRFGLKAKAIVNFVELDRIPFRFRARPLPVFLSNRNLEPLYNVGCTLRAFARIQGEYPEARLIVAGFGSEREHLEAQARALAVTRVEFRGRVSPDEMGRLLDEADVYLNSSNIDNMPLSILEAQAAGLPVVSTRAGGIPYLVEDGETGLLVPLDDDAALAQAAARVLREEGLASRLTMNARRECIARCVWPAVQHSWERAYRDIAAEARVPRSRAESE